MRAFQKAIGDSSWRANAHSRLSKTERDKVVDAFAQEYRFTHAGTEKMKLAFDNVFQNSATDAAAIAHCQQVFDTVLKEEDPPSKAKEKEVSTSPAPALPCTWQCQCQCQSQCSMSMSMSMSKSMLMLMLMPMPIVMALLTRPRK